MPLTPKQLVAAAPVVLVNTALLILISPRWDWTLIIVFFLSVQDKGQTARWYD